MPNRSPRARSRPRAIARTACASPLPMPSSPPATRRGLWRWSTAWGTAAGPARARILARKPSGDRDRHAAEALSEVLTGFAADVARMARSAPPIGLVQVARYANPQNSGAAVLLALLLDDQERSDEAIAVLRSISASDPLMSQAPRHPGANPERPETLQRGLCGGSARRAEIRRRDRRFHPAGRRLCRR